MRLTCTTALHLTKWSPFPHRGDNLRISRTGLYTTAIAGLLPSKGIIYIAFSSFICDQPAPYAGWVLAYRATDLTPVASWETPNPGISGSSGIWQSGRGLVASDDGNIFFMTGNSSDIPLEDQRNEPDDFKDPSLANSFVKLTLDF